jgi:hypothetical protein
MSVFPALKASTEAFCSAAVRRRLTTSTVNGKSARRSEKVPKCC